jgi:tetratricopeptide (TPR) repeat protein
MRENDAAAARTYLVNAIESKSHNGAIWLAYALQEDNRMQSNEALDQALDLDNDLAEAHYEKGVRRHILAQLKTATNQEPRVAKYWNALAQVYLDDNQFPEAGRAWRSAERAATDPAEKAKMHESWQLIEKEKLDYSDSEKKRIADEKASDLEKVKKQALAELHASEARINKSLGSPAVDVKTVPVVPWDEAQPITVTGVLKTVECMGRQTKVSIETEHDGDHLILKLLVLDRKGLACGAQKPKQVTVEYYPKPDAKTGTAGEVAAIAQ